MENDHLIDYRINMLENDFIWMSQEQQDFSKEIIDLLRDKKIEEAEEKISKKFNTNKRKINYIKKRIVNY